jgi:WD40 repeat protein
MIKLFDIRQNESLMKVEAHQGSVCGLALSYKVPGLLATASEDKFVKLWDHKTSNGEFELVYEKKFKMV